MMHYDVIIIGGGVAGYSAGMRCLENGLRTAIVSSGQSALHFSSGSIDLLSHSPVTGEVMEYPLQEIEKLAEIKPNHPYAKLGTEKIAEAMAWYTKAMDRAGLPLTHLESKANHFRISTMGTLKATWLSQPYVKKLDFSFEALRNIKCIMMISLEGFRDFQPKIAQDNLRRYAEFNRLEIHTRLINITGFGQINRNPNEFRSIDISRILREEAQFQELVNQLMSVATPDDLVVIPSIMGNGDGLALLDKLRKQTGLMLHEVPTMPPSLLGIRIEDVMMRSFIKNGGSLLKGDEVLSGEVGEINGALSISSLRTRKMAEIELTADHYVLASGSFFSKGMVAKQNSIIEPIFNLDISETGPRASWYQKDFFTKDPHAFLSFGVETDNQLLPFINGKKVTNLFCTGSVLSGYNPVAHGCGGGVAICTAYAAVDHILAEREEKAALKEVNA
ncbi:glycerol-3-phosphate dehydrogenase subunit GlpB [Vibrio sp. JC009]|uniref:glycerol-3-phosphate dehydrogenase subunit GlpB n=1 Tax=Vibrio sp. JC009 TaxID=2912314 RepID=UPI0023B0D94D|nr:glycerol-3-phosphate dehydrogenase subunit GlpB [Vibrio sp. JC009]WED24778.1 glycerol-3-phosphate dehydrogenase subunit GlpB [Vibrio sp. JC009]